MDVPKATASSDDEHEFVDANERIVDELIKETIGVQLETDPRHDEENDDDSDNENPEEFEDCKALDMIDDESQKDAEKDQTEEERETARLESESLKQQGNDLFRSAQYLESVEKYTDALRTCPVLCAADRSILYGNRAAAKQKLDMKSAAIDDCTKSLEFNPKYVKVLMRLVFNYILSF